MTFGSVFGRTFSPTFQPSSQAAKAGAWKPTDITGCVMWIDFSDADYLFTDAGSTKVSADGDAIYQANDKSGNARNAVQTTLANRPLYKTNIKNSKSIARFDGNNDVLIHTLNQTNSIISVFAIISYGSQTGWNGIFATGNTGDGNGINLLATCNNTKWGTWGNGKGLFANSSVIGAGFVLLCMVANGSGTFYLNGTSDGSFAATSGQGLNTIGGFTDQNVAGDIAEVVVYNSALSEANRQSVETYLNNKWTIY